MPLTLLANRYRLEAQIAMGMSGPVYRGLDTATGQSVAIKGLQPDLLTRQPALLTRFQREDDILRRLAHPNIVTRLDVVDHEGVHFLVMEYVPGGSLDDLLADGSLLPLERVLTIALDLADALTRAHRLGIIHRDIKPQNVLLAADGTPRLSDFGVAHYVRESADAGPESMVGTLAYMPPEAFAGGEVDARADIWSFGILLFEMLTGRLPFHGATIAAQIHAILTQPVPDPRATRPDTPAGLAELLACMLERDRGERLPSIRLVGAALEAIARGQTPPLPAPRPPTPPALPSTPTSFIGRSDLLATIVERLQDGPCRLLTLTGPGGVGKTRLALEAARVLQKNYPQSVTFVDLAPLTSAQQVPERIAQALDIKTGASRTPKADLIASLAPRRALLLLDNLEQILDAAPLLAELLEAAPRLAFLVTSREPLRLYGEQELGVPPLTLPGPEAAPDESEAVVLFVERARAVDPAFAITAANRDAIAAICARLDGLPLAIELAAARTRLFTPAYLLTRLDDVLGTLTSGPRDWGGRHQTLRAAIGWSYELLDMPEKRLFARLAAFQGGRSLAAALAICSDDVDSEAAVLNRLTSLYDKNLLRQNTGPDGAPRFTMLETIHQFGREILNESAEADEIRMRHARYFADLAEEAAPALSGPRQSYWSAVLRADYDNLRAALEWAFDRGDCVVGLRIAAALAEFWYYEGPIIEGEKWLFRAVTLLECAPARIQARTLNSAGIMAFAAGDHAQGRAWSRAALEIYRELDDPGGKAWSLFWLSAHTTVSPENYQEGIDLCEQALTLFRSTGDLAGVAWSTNQLGEFTRLTGDYVRARAAYSESLAVCRQTGNRRREAIALVNLGYVAFHQSDFHGAERYIRGGLALLHDLALPYHSAIALAMLSGPTVALGRAAAGVRMLGASAAAFERMAVGLQPADQVEIDQFTAAGRAALTPAAFSAAWEKGQSTPFDAAVAEACARLVDEPVQDGAEGCSPDPLGQRQHG